MVVADEGFVAGDGTHGPFTRQMLATVRCATGTIDDLHTFGVAAAAGGGEAASVWG